MNLPDQTSIVPVLLPIPTERPYSYRAPDDMQLAPGDIVQVPLGPRLVAAVVWDGDTDDVDASKLRDIEQKFDCPPIQQELRRFIEWIANYTLSPPGMVLRMVLRVPAALEAEKPMEAWRWKGPPPERLTKARKQVIETITSDEALVDLAWSRSGLAHASGVSSSVINGMIKLGCFEQVHIPPPPVVEKPEPEHQHPVLTDEQDRAADVLLTMMLAEEFSVALIDGITGSGKTEVYFEAIAEALRNDRQILILLPEIALTKSFLERFEARFGAPPAEWHSELNPKKREKTWRQVTTGQVRVVAGARSALFLPFENLGLIIVDEEHDAAYKQQDRVFYNARDMAVVRASINNIPVILASATPSIESRVNADRGRYKRIILSERHGGATLPDLAIIDMRRDPPPRGSFLSPVMTGAMVETLVRGEQSLLFLNRRGYAPLTLCRVCGYRFQCNNCTAWMVEHRFRGQLQCHHCGHSEPVPQACPSCGTLDHLVACGPGVERLGEEVNRLFPDARTIILSSDMMGGVSRLRLELEVIAKGGADIIIGTQLVAKGHNFPLMTLVGVVDADIGLNNADPRAAERTFQLLSQVTGRAGRAGGKSRGLLQTYQSDHPVIRAITSGKAEAFIKREIEARKLAQLPPFGRLAGIIISASDRRDAETHARSLRNAAPASREIMILGPAEAPMALIRGRYRFRILVQSARQIDLQNYMRKWIGQAPKTRGNVRVQIDMDPQSFL
ncbi:MAG: primosomal protein N' [Rhodobacteraceae bacterium]|nr:primosomal protein N' [Paracoccaceae bacterium]